MRNEKFSPNCQIEMVQTAEWRLTNVKKIVYNFIVMPDKYRNITIFTRRGLSVMLYCNLGMGIMRSSKLSSAVKH